ncbi:MAG: transglutaminase-like cysteine peptidase [Methylocystis sp.]
MQTEALQAATAKASFAPVGDESSVPYGWMDFCTRQPQECDQPSLPAENFKLTTKAWKLLGQINAEVNAAIEPVSNLEHWGTLADHWDYPLDGKGDCKIYALEKRRQLIERGVPRQALLMTIVKDHHNMGHTILTVRTDKGDFILDNLTDEILSWDETGYHFLKRQSQEDPNIWLAILSPASPRKISAR